MSALYCRDGAIVTSSTSSLPGGELEAVYHLEDTVVTRAHGKLLSERVVTPLVFRTEPRPNNVGVMVVGLGGSNGSTLVASLMANAQGLSWAQRSGRVHANWHGSVTQASSVRLGRDAETGIDVHVPFAALLPLADPATLHIHGWDICGSDLAAACSAAKVLEPDLLRQLAPALTAITPLPAPFYPDFIAANQASRADNVLHGADKAAHLRAIRDDIAAFKRAHALNACIILWSANTERFAVEAPGVNDTADALLKAIDVSHPEVSPSQLFAVAALQEGCPFINASPQNTLLRGVVELAEQLGGCVAGDDLKSGQTKLKSVLVDFLTTAGIVPLSIASYNHLGNNDGKNLSAEAQFHSKEVSKRGVVDDAVEAAGFAKPDHVVVIKYVPAVGDSKRAMDEYYADIAMNGKLTMAIHTTCEDSLLAVPLLLDLVLLAELTTRITVRGLGSPVSDGVRLHPCQSLLSYFLKAPVVPPGAPVLNALHAQREALVNVLRAARGLPPNNAMDLLSRLPCPLGHVGLTAPRLVAASTAAAATKRSADLTPPQSPRPTLAALPRLGG